MRASAQLAVDGVPVPGSLYDAILDWQIEENSDRPGTLHLRLPADRTAHGDLRFVGDGSFEPMTNLAVTVTPGRTGARTQCIFDGYVLAWRLHLTRASTASSVDVWAQDASWLMNLDDRVTEWSGLSDGEVADMIFTRYGFTPAPGNGDDSPRHLPEGHTLLQRATDLQFLRTLARRGGRLLRVGATGTPGRRTGYFTRPAVTGPTVATISLVDPERWTVESLEFDWDVMRPTQVTAGQVDLGPPTPTGTEAVTTASGLGPLDRRTYAAYLARPSSLLLTVAADVAELGPRGRAVLAESDFFARCTGQVDVDRIGTVLRVGDVVAVEGAGNLQSGRWLVWRVRHRYSPDGWTMEFTLVRNAIGPPAPPAGRGAPGRTGAGLLSPGRLP